MSNRAKIAELIGENPIKAYRAAFPQWDAPMLEHIPEHMRAGMVRYLVLGIMPGSFLSYVLEGQLFPALAHADETNKHRLFDYALFLVNAAPAGCYGSPEKVKNWCLRGGLVGIKKEREGKVHGN